MDCLYNALYWERFFYFATLKIIWEDAKWRHERKFRKSINLSLCIWIDRYFSLLLCYTVDEHTEQRMGRVKQIVASAELMYVAELIKWKKKKRIVQATFLRSFDLYRVFCYQTDKH